MRNNLYILIIFAISVFSGCGSVAIYGVPIGTPPRTQFENASKYVGADISDEASLSRYLRTIKNVEGQVVGDDSGTYYHRIVDGYVAQFFISKSLEYSFRNSFSNGQAFLYPMYRHHFINGLTSGQCGSQVKYDAVVSKNWVDNLVRSKVNVLPIENTNHFALLNQQYLSSYLAGSLISTEDQASKSKSAIGGAAIFITDSSNEYFLQWSIENKSKDGREVRRCSSNQVYTHPIDFTLSFFDIDAVAQAKGRTAYGLVSARCIVINWKGVIANMRQSYVDFTKVEKTRTDLQVVAYSFCNEAIDALKLTRRIESSPLR